MDNLTLRLPRLVIAAPQGRSGKTTVSLGVCAALARRGLRVQPFKKGPDYIDPSWLSEAAGRPCRSLDSFFMPDPGDLRHAFLKGGREADISLVEGNHGLYDSLEEDGRGSTADVARLLNAPVILVVNAARMTRSAAAMVLGYQHFEPETPLAAVILNNVAQERHESKLRQAIENICHIPVVGALPRNDRLTIPDRHLGLVPRGENEGLVEAIWACQEAIERHVDLEALLEIARGAPIWEEVESAVPVEPSVRSGAAPAIGVLRDRAFTFYYPENLEALEEAGGRLVFIDAIQARHLPQVNALYIGGGFPEMFLDELSANRSFRQDVRQAIEGGLPVYAECGGLMYLSRRIYYQGRSGEMVGVLPCEIEMTAKPQGHGYVQAETSGENPFFPRNLTLRGHEFHNSRLVNFQWDLPTAFQIMRGNGLGLSPDGTRCDGLVYRNVLASYMHVHTGGAPGWAEGVVMSALSFSIY
jgi:cobyrinic acid a,c-diamide synthase